MTREEVQSILDKCRKIGTDWRLSVPWSGFSELRHADGRFIGGIAASDNPRAEEEWLFIVMTGYLLERVCKAFLEQEPKNTRAGELTREELIDIVLSLRLFGMQRLSRETEQHHKIRRDSFNALAAKVRVMMEGK